jgi:hypothetical protein
VRAVGGCFGAMFAMSWRSRFGLIRKLGLSELGVKFVKYFGSLSCEARFLWEESQTAHLGA